QDRHAHDREFKTERQPQRRLSDRGLPRHLLPRPGPPGGPVVLPELTRPSALGDCFADGGHDFVCPEVQYRVAAGFLPASTCTLGGYIRQRWLSGEQP